MKTWNCLVFAGLAVLFLVLASYAQDYNRIGGRFLLSYNLPMLSFRNNSAVRWGGSVVYNVDSKFRAENTVCFRPRNPIPSTQECVGFLGGFL